MDRELTAELVAERFARAATVKSNPVREVRTDGTYYYKLDTRPGHGFAGELRAAKLLEARNVPVVEHLWCGDIPAGNVLVTRALRDAPTVKEFLAHRVPDAEFRREFAEFVRAYLASGLDHDDMHVGNILYPLAEKRFVLVDVRAVRSSRRGKYPYEICRAPMELRKHLSKAEVCAMLEVVGIPDPDRFFERSLEIEARRINRAWPKRRAQILGGYLRFTRREGKMLVAAEASPEDIRNLSWRPGSAAAFVSAFYWDLAEIPAAERILAFDPERRTIGVAPALFPTPLAPEELELRRRILAETAC